MPADAAGLSPQMTVLAVDGRAYSTDALEAAIVHPHPGGIVFVVRNFDRVDSVTLHYAGGLRYPHLKRVPGTPDLLTAIFTPKNVTR
jgi:hypothetical protein